MNNTFEVTKRIKDVEEEIAINEKNMVNQCHEIIKTETFISQYQQTLKSQTDLLKEYVLNKEKLEKDKESLMKLYEDQENARKMVVQKNLERNACQYITKSKLPLFTDTYQLHQSTKSLRYYRAINVTLLEACPLLKIYYPNQMAIPNKLKSLTSERSMLLYRVNTADEYPLADIIGCPITMSVDIHVSQGTGELISVRGIEPDIQYHTTPLVPAKTYSIRQSQTSSTRFILLVHTSPMTLGLDIISNTQTQLAAITVLPVPEGYSLVSNSKKSNDSFIKRNLTFTEIRDRVLFLDAHFADTSNGGVVPIELAVIDYHSKVLINTFLCPRQKIKNYRDHSERELIGKPDSEEMMKYFYSVVWDRILIGHNLKQKIQDLKIDVKYLCGIKDLQSNFVFQSKDKSVFTLEEISERVLKEPMATGVSTALRNTETMRKIYLFMESKWQRSVKRENVGDLWDPISDHIAPDELII